MPSFIDLMANDVWTAADIKNRLHAEIRSEISEQAETELNRALQGAIMKMHTLTAGEQQELLKFKAATDRASAIGAEARADWILLSKTFAHEAAVARLALPVLIAAPVKAQKADAMVPENIAIDPSVLDASERTEAQAVLDAATPEVVELVALRHAQNNPPTPPIASETKTEAKP